MPSTRPPPLRQVLVPALVLVLVLDLGVQATGKFLPQARVTSTTLHAKFPSTHRIRLTWSSGVRPKQGLHENRV